MKIFKLFVTIITVLLLTSCMPYKIKAESDGATQEQQQEVKKQVIKLLEEEYKQPFKLESFDYKYDTHWKHIDCQIAGYCPKVQYGTYFFKIKAVDNPIITINFKFDDENKESIKDSIDSFKKNQLNHLYCRALDKYYRDSYNTHKKVITTYTQKAENLCDSINDFYYKDSKDYYLQHESEYK